MHIPGNGLPGTSGFAACAAPLKKTASLLFKHEVRSGKATLRIRTPAAFQRAAHEENVRPRTRAVMKAEALEIEDPGFGRRERVFHGNRHGHGYRHRSRNGFRNGFRNRHGNDLSAFHRTRKEFTDLIKRIRGKPWNHARQNLRN